MKRNGFRISVVVPIPLAEWIDAEAKNRGMNRSQFVNWTFNNAQAFQVAERLTRLEKRVVELEASLD